MLQFVKPEEFQATAPGRLVPIPDGWAFVPEDLPPALPLTWDLMAANERASRALGELAGQARLVSNETLIMGPLLTREAVESNRIEGTHTLIEEVLLQKAAGPPRDSARADSNLEVLRYIETLYAAAAAIADGQPLSLFLLRSMHRTLLAGTPGETRSPGSFRSRLVAIGRDGQTPLEARFVPPPYEHVPAAIDNLIEFISDDSPFGPLITCAVMHYQFETIHPFEDGNGRLGRLLVPVYLLWNGAIDRPLLYLSSFLESHRDEYVDRLKAVSTRGDWSGWISFFLRAVEAQALDARDRVARILELQDDYRARIKSGSRTQTPLVALDLVLERVYVSIPDVSAYAKKDYKTAKAAVATLTELGILKPSGEGHPQRWVAHELLSHIYKN